MAVDIVTPNAERDPHLLPSFEGKNLIQPTQPVLYLPPLLSSLPLNVAMTFKPPANSNERYRPLSTETRLPSIDPASLSLHKALHHFRPIDMNYSNLAYHEAFNWDELELPEDEEREWYCVVFRSKRKEGSDSGRKCY
jgi:hypothetical protein